MKFYLKKCQKTKQNKIGLKFPINHIIISFVIHLKQTKV